MAESYTVQEYVDDLRRITGAAADESEIIKQVRPLAEKLAQNRDGWMKPEYYDYDEDRGSGLHVLHEEPDHTLMVFAAAFRPGRLTPIHDHGTWAVVAGVDGEETNTIYSRVDDGSKPGFAELEKRGEKTFRHGEALALRTGSFHTVLNPADTVSVSLHTYGMNTNHTVRCQVDPETGAVAEFKIPLRR